MKRLLWFGTIAVPVTLMLLHLVGLVVLRGHTFAERLINQREYTYGRGAADYHLVSVRHGLKLPYVYEFEVPTSSTLHVIIEVDWLGRYDYYSMRE
ncbi:MAG: hypothetical protein ACR2IE_15280 [Candidatus Sumerlaeaceae bacterium]